MDYLYRYDAPLGKITLVSDGHSLTRLMFGGQQFQGKEIMLPVLADTCRWLDIYFSGHDPGFLPELAPEGTPFRKEVWELLLTIPYGRTASYGALAAKTALMRGMDKMSAQAIGGAVGHNPIPIIIPCHRVIAADGSIGGFSAGIEIKKWLLRHESI